MIRIGKNRRINSKTYLKLRIKSKKISKRLNNIRLKVRSNAKFKCSVISSRVRSSSYCLRMIILGRHCHCRLIQSPFRNSWRQGFQSRFSTIWSFTRISLRFLNRIEARSLKTRNVTQLSLSYITYSRSKCRYSRSNTENTRNILSFLMWTILPQVAFQWLSRLHQLLSLKSLNNSKTRLEMTTLKWNSMMIFWVVSLKTTISLAILYHASRIRWHSLRSKTTLWLCKRRSMMLMISTIAA